jgi:hypothetical protein
MKSQDQAVAFDSRVGTELPMVAGCISQKESTRRSSKQSMPGGRTHSELKQ